MLAIAPGWELGVERGPDWLLVKVESVDEDAIDAPPLADEIWSLLECHFTYRLVLELDQVHLLNSHLVGQLVMLYKRIREHGGVMRLCGLSDFNRRVLRICQLEDRFLPCRDRKEAVLGRPHFRQPK